MLSAPLLSSAQEGKQPKADRQVGYVDERIIENNRWATTTLGGVIYDAKASDLNPDLIFTLSETALSAVSRSNGRIVWRRELPRNHG